MQNKVEIKGGSGIKWVDTEISQGLFKRELGKNILTIENGIIILKEKVLPAKPFKCVSLEKNISKDENFMTMDIETDISQKDGKHYPYLITGYTEISNKNIAVSSFVDGPVRNEDTQTRLFNNFIEKILKLKTKNQFRKKKKAKKNEKNLINKKNKKKKKNKNENEKYDK